MSDDNATLISYQSVPVTLIFEVKILICEPKQFMFGMFQSPNSPS